MNLVIKQLNLKRADKVITALRSSIATASGVFDGSAVRLPPQATPFVAFRDDRVVACCAALMQSGAATTGTIGWFEAHDDQEAVSTLLKNAVGQLKQQGATRVVGPMDGDTWHSYRFVISDFERAPFIKEPANPPYYPQLWESAGFSVAESYDTFVINEVEKAADKLKPFYQRAVRNGYCFEPILKKNYFAKLPVIHALSCRIFENNVLYSPIDYSEFEALYRPAKPILKDGLSWLAWNSAGAPAGFIFTYPDLVKAVNAMRGGSGVLAGLNFLLNRGKATRSCIKSLGVIPESRGSGLSSALMHLATANSSQQGYQQSLMCLMHSRNDSRRMGGSFERPYRKYALYEAKL
ncbi:MAG: hypothetical protein PHO37_08315 [Kiritimatiellae bacterium]|nr:hypothetical protein [Kiritimatiellia bacterium]